MGSAENGRKRETKFEKWEKNHADVIVHLYAQPYSVVQYYCTDFIR